MNNRANERNNAEIFAGLDVMAEYKAMGVEFISATPRSNGMAACRSAFRDEKKASAWVNTKTGLYGDSGSDEKAITLWEFAARKGLFSNWREARKHYANKAGVEQESAPRPKANQPTDVLEFEDWSPANLRLLKAWEIRGRRGVISEAVRLAGGLPARYPCYVDKKTGERKIGKDRVIALPCYGEQLLAAPPVAWVLYNITGASLEVYQGKGKPPEFVKMKSVGPTRGTMMNPHSLGLLDKREEELIWKTAGPSDMLAVLSTILRDSPQLLEKHLVTTNASSETGDVLPHQANLFADRKVFLVHDADKAGEEGAAKWCHALWNRAAEARKINLPYRIAPKSGLDVRDYLNGVPAEVEILPDQQTELAAA